MGLIKKNNRQEEQANGLLGKMTESDPFGGGGGLFPGSDIETPNVSEYKKRMAKSKTDDLAADAEAEAKDESSTKSSD